MLSIRRVGASVFALLIVASSFAASVVGSWHGRADFSGYKPKNAKQEDPMRKMVASMSFAVQFKADKTCTFTISGGMSKTPQKKQGTWSQAANVVTMKDGPTTNQLILSANGKTLTMTPVGADGVRLIFTH
jgi:hypothetical protein